MKYLVDANDNELIWVQCRRCKRCGGLIFSDDAVRDGYGHHCLSKMIEEEQRRAQINGQECLFNEQDGPEN